MNDRERARLRVACTTIANDLDVIVHSLARISHQLGQTARALVRETDRRDPDPDPIGTAPCPDRDDLADDITREGLHQAGVTYSRPRPPTSSGQGPQS